jgi:hypothetical protein
MISILILSAFFVLMVICIAANRYAQKFITLTQEDKGFYINNYFLPAGLSKKYFTENQLSGRRRNLENK